MYIIKFILSRYIGSRQFRAQFVRQFSLAFRKVMILLLQFKRNSLFYHDRKKSDIGSRQFRDQFVHFIFRVWETDNFARVWETDNLVLFQFKRNSLFHYEIKVRYRIQLIFTLVRDIAYYKYYLSNTRHVIDLSGLFFKGRASFGRPTRPRV